MSRCITEFLLHEHHELTQLLNKLSQELQSLPLAQNASQSVERLEGCYRQISQTLRTHLDEEEKILYPALEEHVEGITTTLDRMRHARDAGEAAEKAFIECLKHLGRSSKNRTEAVQAGRSYIQWVRSLLMNENGRLLPLVERRLDPGTQRLVRQAMEELARETTARIAESIPQGEQS